MKRLCPKEKILYADEIDLDEFLSQTAKDNKISTNFLADYIDNITKDLEQSRDEIAKKYGIEPDDFRIAALAKQQKEYFGHE